ncbi:MAG: SBBP repeat-containing protein [Candidatus Sulfotelmatobacter sp.]|jgi:hypothetical protein
MGNGRKLSGRRLSEETFPGVSPVKKMERNARVYRVFTALSVVIVAGGLALGMGLRRSPRTASTQLPASRSSVSSPVSPAPAALHRLSSLDQPSLEPPSSRTPDAQSVLGQLPLIFEPNQGQADPAVKFVSRGPGYNLFLDQTGAVLATPDPRRPHPDRTLDLVRMTLVGANRTALMAGTEPLPGKTNYFIGNDPKKWQTGVAQFAGVRYQSVYPGIDLVFYGNQGRLEYDFKVAPGANPAQAELQFEGASKLQLAGDDLVLKGSGIRLQAPRVYQMVAGKQQKVEGHFVLRAENRVGFEIGRYDRSRELVIDPFIIYSTYFGGSGSETAPSIAVNGDGFIYLAGSTTSTNLPVGTFTLTGGTAPTTESLRGTQNIFVLKVDPTLGARGLLYLTYLGGNGTDSLAGSVSNIPTPNPAPNTNSSSAGLAVDNGGNIYVGGTTTSTNFPTTNGYQSVPLAGSAGTSHVFVSEISAPSPTTATLSYSTYLSGNGTDVASAIAIDTKGDVFVTGTTTSTDVATGFPSSSLPVPFQQTPSSSAAIQFFVTEVNTRIIGPDSVPYSTYFGGATTGTTAEALANNIGGGIAVDTSGIVYFSGTTNMYNSGEGTNGTGGLATGDFPILNAYQACLNSYPSTAVVPPVTCGAATTSPTTDAFVAKLNPPSSTNQGAQLLFSTYLGGSGDDSSSALTIDTGAAGIYITGTTDSPDFVPPTGSGAFQECLDTPVNPTALPCPTIATPAATDAFVGKFTNPTEATSTGTGTGTTTTTTTTTTSTNQVILSYFSYLGGSGNDGGLGIAVDTASGALVTGWTSSGTIGVVSPTTGFPVTSSANFNPIQSVLSGPQNAFFARIDTTAVAGSGSVASYATYYGGNGTDSGTSITIDPILDIYFAGQTTSTQTAPGTFPLRGPLQNCIDTPVNPASGAPCPTIAGPLPDAFAVKLLPTSLLSLNAIPPTYSTGSTTTGGSPLIGAGNAITVTFTLINEGPDLASNITVTGTVTSGAAFSSGSPATAGSGTCSAATGLNVACTIPSLQSGSTSLVAFSVTPTVAGNYSVTATVNDSNNTNPSVTLAAPFTATSYTMQVLPSSQTVVAGNVAPFSVQVVPQITYGNNVSLSCSSLPVGASCGFSPATLPFNGPSTLSSTLNLTTTARPITTISSIGWRSPFYALWLMFPGMAFVGVGKRKRRWLGWLGVLTLFSLVMLLPACSKAKQQPIVSGTPAGTYPITVTATSGSYTQSYGITLTVQ